MASRALPPRLLPCSTSMSNIFGPSDFARSKAPRPASQILWAEAATALPISPSFAALENRLREVVLRAMNAS